MVLGYVITPVGLRVEFLWNDALYSTKTHCGVLDVIIELTISYDVSSIKGKKAMLYPDFVFFVRDADTGGIVPAVVDPHGDFLGDSVDKWKGAIEYLQDYPDMMKYYWSVYKRNGNYWYIDLMDPEVQKDVMSGDYSAAELFEKHQSLYISGK